MPIMGHTLWGNIRKKIRRVLSSGGLKENKEDRENIYLAVPQWQALAFSTLTIEFLPQSHNVASTIIPFYT